MKTNPIIEKILREKGENVAVELKTLGEVAHIKTGELVTKEIISQNPGIYPVINSGKEPLGFINKWNVENDPIGIATRGSVGYVTWQEGRFFRGNLNYSVSVKNKEILSTRFLYHFLLSSEKEIHQLCTFTGIPALNASNLKKLKIPIPPLEVQREIVSLLDNFTELTAELTARKKQYEYYRNLLLDFSNCAGG